MDRTKLTHQRLIFCLALGLAVAVFLIGLPTAAQSPPPTEPGNALRPDDTSSVGETEPTGASDATGQNRLTPQQIENRLAAIEQVPEPARAKVRELYEQALAVSGKVAEQESSAAQFDKKATEWGDSDALLLQLSLSNDETRDRVVPNVNIEELSLEELDKVAEQWSDEIAALRTELIELEAIPERRRTREAAIKGNIAEAERARDTFAGQLRKLAGVDSPGALDQAAVALLEQQLALEQAKTETFAAEAKYFSASTEVLPLQKEWLTRVVVIREEALRNLRDSTSSRRSLEDKRQARAAEEAANQREIQRIPLLKELAESNESFAKQKVKLGERNAEVDKLVDSLGKQIVNLQRDLQTLESRFADGQTTSHGGDYLREQKSRLPNIPAINRAITTCQQEQSDVLFKLYEISDLLNGTDDIDRVVAENLKLIDPADRATGEPLLRWLLANRRSYLTELNNEYDDYSRSLGNLVAKQIALQATADKIRDFIAARDLWIRNCQPLGMGSSSLDSVTGEDSPWKRDLRLAYDAVIWTFDPANWSQLASDLYGAVRRKIVVSVLLTFAFVALLFVQRRGRRDLGELGTQAVKPSAIEFLPTMRAVWLTLVVSLPWPLLVWSLSWMLTTPLVESEFTRSLAFGLRECAWLLFLSEFFRQAYRKDGIADAHFGWTTNCITQIRGYLRLVPMVVLPLVLWMIGLATQTLQPLWSVTLGRLLFIAIMAMVATVLWRTLLVESSPMLQLIRRNAKGVVMGLHRLWRPLLVLLPVVLAVLAVAGYFHTAEQLALRCLYTLTFIGGLALLGGLLTRWVVLRRRKLAREQARQRRAAALAAAEAAGSAGEALPAAVVEANDEAVDLNALSDQTRKLINTALQFTGFIAAVVIWQDVFPALAILDENTVPLLPTIDGVASLTYGQLLRFAIAVIITYAAVRDLPSLLELSLLQQLPIDQGARYAISALVRYALLCVGILVAAATLGINSTSISWLAAAVSVGLGFGLQEIFANFVSGIILLFERPIRVGDIVTLGDKTGIVTRIRIRATTIVDWDRKEYIVPNKDLVTERLLNWTLTDQTNRVVINIGVAYGSDTELAVSLLREVCEEHPLILDDPRPLTTFEGFGDSTLNLVLRCYLPDLENRLQVIHELHTEIDRKYRENDIEIAFPQQDVHIRSSPPGWIDSADKSTKN